MTKMLDYYKEYFAKGGGYTCASQGFTSRVLNFCDWITTYLPAQSKILDLGCGDCTYSKTLPEYDWVNMDINLDKASGNTVQQDLESYPYPFESQSFEAVVCSEVLEHLWDMDAVHQEVFRILKPGGYYLISTPNLDWIDNLLEGHNRLLFDKEKAWTLEHIRHYDYATHFKYLTKNGFTVIDKVGADAQFSPFFKEARSALRFLLVSVLKLPEFENEYKVDQIIGRMFTEFSHTICVAARKL